jgi:hypothetical protein
MGRMYGNEADLHQGVRKCLGRMDDVSNRKTSHDELHMGIRSLPLFVTQSRTFQQVGNVRSVDPELLYSENKLGCARGVIWAFIFEAALIIAIAIFWKFRLLPR